MFFNLKRSDDASVTTRPPEFYVNHGKQTLSVPYPMVIFCDQETRPLLEPIRGTEHPTIYIERSIFDYDHVKSLLPIVKENRKSSPHYMAHNERNIPSHFMVTSFKPYAMYLAKQSYPADYYMWLDLGGSHVLRGFPDAVHSIVKNPRPKIASCYIHYRARSELYPETAYLSFGPCGFAGTAFTVQSEYIERFYTGMFGIMYDQVSKGVGHTEEQCMIYLYDEHPDWFTLYFGDYYSCLTNYHSTREDRDCVRVHFIENARKAGRNDLAALAEQSMKTD